MSELLDASVHFLSFVFTSIKLVVLMAMSDTSSLIVWLAGVYIKQWLSLSIEVGLVLDLKNKIDTSSVLWSFLTKKRCTVI